MYSKRDCGQCRSCRAKPSNRERLRAERVQCAVMQAMQRCSDAARQGCKVTDPTLGLMTYPRPRPRQTRSSSHLVGLPTLITLITTTILRRWLQKRPVAAPCCAQTCNTRSSDSCANIIIICEELVLFWFKYLL